MPAHSSSVEAHAWVARGDGGRWPLRLGRPARERWLSTRRRRGIARCRPPRQWPYMDPSSFASTPFFGGEVRLLTYIRPLTAASI